jgi:hypothetical protein
MISGGDIRGETARSFLVRLLAINDGQRAGGKAFVVASLLVGPFLLLAAGLKLHGMSRPIVDISVLSSPQMQIAAVQAEIVIGCLLLSGRCVRLAWLLAISFFFLVGSVSFYVALTGQRYCPSCFGAVRVPSWATCALDGGIVALLAVCRPTRGENLPWRGALSVVAGAALVCGALFALTPERALAFLQGQHISVTPAVSDLGHGRVARREHFESRSRITPRRQSIFSVARNRAAVIQLAICPLR